MALRSLRQAEVPPASGAQLSRLRHRPKLKDEPHSKLAAAFADPTKFGSVREMAQTVRPLMLEKSRYNPYFLFLAYDIQNFLFNQFQR
ncbi:hypothetical protein BS78_06G215900 [Paspalum vaginatum]|nr:hypothetical protein BS78_06G215900 [Paspalum vaginatum]